MSKSYDKNNFNKNNKNHHHSFLEKFKGRIEKVGRTGLMVILKKSNSPVRSLSELNSQPIIFNSNINKYDKSDNISIYTNNTDKPINKIKLLNEEVKTDFTSSVKRKKTLHSLHSDKSDLNKTNLNLPKINKNTVNENKNSNSNRQQSKFITNNSQLVKIEEEEDENIRIKPTQPQPSYQPISYNIISNHQSKQNNIYDYNKQLNFIEKQKNTNDNENKGLNIQSNTRVYREYKPYTIKDYQELSKNFSEINKKSLGANIGTEDWQKRNEKIQKLKKYSNAVVEINKEIKKKDIDLQSEVEINKRDQIENSKRIKAVRYSGYRFFPKAEKVNITSEDFISKREKNEIMKSYYINEFNDKIYNPYNNHQGGYDHHEDTNSNNDIIYGIEKIMV